MSADHEDATQRLATSRSHPPELADIGLTRSARRPACRSDRATPGAAPHALHHTAAPAPSVLPLTERPAMRVAVISDAHIDHGVHGLDASHAWNAATSHIAEQQIDLAVIAGDMFHSGRPDGVALNRAAAGFETMTAAGVPVLVISGNHEWIGAKANATGRCLPIEAFSGLSRVRVIRTPTLMNVPGTDLRIAAIPWPEPGRTAEHVRGDAGRLAELLDDHTGPRLCIAHAAVEGAAVKTRRGTELDLWRFAEEPIVPLADIDVPEAFARTVLGHVHRRQNLSDTCSYVGSTEALGFGDDPDIPKGFSVLEWDDPSQTWTDTLIEVGQHQFVTVDVSPDDNLDDALDNLPEGAMVRLRIAERAGAEDVARSRSAVRDRGGKILQAAYDQPSDDPDDNDDDEWDDTGEDDAHPEMTLEELLDRWYETASIPSPDRPEITRLALQVAETAL